MEDEEVEILVHISAPCSYQDDSRYRKQAEELIAFLDQDLQSSKASSRGSEIPDNRHNISSLSSRAGLDTRVLNESIFGEATRFSHRQESPFQERPRQGMTGFTATARNESAPVTAAAAAVAAVVQVGQSPMLSRKLTPLSRWRAAPASVKETPLAAAPGPENALVWQTPPGTVPDSQPSFTSLKRAFLEDLINSDSFNEVVKPVDPQAKRTRTEPPSPANHAIGEQSSEALSTSPRPRPWPQSWKSGPAGSSNDQSLPTSSSSPSRRARISPGLYHASDRGGVDSLKHHKSKIHIHEDEEAAHAYDSSSSAPEQASQDPLPLQSSQSSPNRQARSLGDTSDSCPEHTAPRPLPKKITLAAARQGQLLRKVSSESSFATAPRARTSEEVFTSHLTPALQAIRARFQPLSKYYSPRWQSRPIRPLERGYWYFTLPDTWTGTFCSTFWSRLCAHIQRGRAGFGTRAERVLDGQEIGTSQGGEDAFRAQDIGTECWRVWCWGETLVEIWLLLYIDSSRATRGLDMAWRDGADNTAVQV